MTDSIGLESYDYDPAAQAWARGHVEKLVTRYRKFEADARSRGDALESQWRKFANLLEMELIGGSGCVIRPFDPRAAEMHKILRDSAEEKP